HRADAERGPDDIVAAFCAELAGNLAVLHEIAAWMAQGSKTDRERAAELVAALATRPGPAMWSAVRTLVLTKDGEARKDPVTKRHSATRPELRAQIDRLQSDLLLVEEARRAARAAMLAEAALTIAEAMRDEYATMKEARGVLDYDDLI